MKALERPSLPGVGTTRSSLRDRVIECPAEVEGRVELDSTLQIQQLVISGAMSGLRIE